MQRCFEMRIKKQKEQTLEKTYSGGKPHLPINETLPKCSLCCSDMTFFFQVTFPSGHDWFGFTFSLFACTSCYSEDYLIPEMLTGNLKGINIPDGFLNNYQKNFRVLVFPTDQGILAEEYKEKIIFKPIELYELNTNKQCNKVGGTPDWYLDDETPATYEGKQVIFLFQILEGFEFDIYPNVEGQVKYNFLKNSLEHSNKPYYELFSQNNIYLFGTKTTNKPKVYIITQI